MREKFRQFMIGRYGTDGLNQFLSIASIVLLLISLLTRFSLFTWLGLVLLVLCYYRSLSRNISKRTEENYQYYALKDRVDRKFRGLKDQWANRMQMVLVEIMPVRWHPNSLWRNWENVTTRLKT